MRSVELETLVREVADAVINGQPVEDTRVELKARWVEPDKAAKQLAGHANAARGDALLWIIGIDERNAAICGVDPQEFEHWHKRVQKWFDGFAPELLNHLNVRIGSETVVGLYYETEKYAPYVVTNSQGGYPEFIVPWRDGTRLRAARREELLRILLPIVKQPTIRLATATLTKGMDLSSVYSARPDTNITWTFEGLVYITPADLSRIVIPFSQWEVWIGTRGHETLYRLWTNFHPANYKQPKNPPKKTIKLGRDHEVDMPPAPRESFTIACAETELIIDGPGSAFLTASAAVPRAFAPLQDEEIFLKVKIRPGHSERVIAIERSLRQKPKAAGIYNTFSTGRAVWTG